MIPRISVASAARDLGLPAYRAMLAELGEAAPTSEQLGPIASPEPAPLPATSAEEPEKPTNSEGEQ